MGVARTCRTTLALLVVGATCIACTAGTTLGRSDAPASVGQSPAVSPSVDASFERIVVESMAFRRHVGLRSYETWVREVAADGGARHSYGVPLTLREEAELDGRPYTVDEVQPTLATYVDEHAAEFGGLFIGDRATVVLLFTGRLADHEAAIAKLIRPGAPVEVRQAEVALQSLEGLFDQIAADGDTLRELGIVVVTSALRERDGTVHVALSTERSDAVDVMAARYGPRVTVEVLDPTGAFLKPRGTIALRVTDERGRGVEAGIGHTPLFAEIPLDAMGIQTDAHGRIRLDDQLPGPWRLTAQAPGFEPGSADVVVVPGAVVDATIELLPSS